MKKYYLILFVLAMVAGTKSKAQIVIDTPAIINAYVQSDYIFEGIVNQQCVYEDAAGNLYTSNQIQLTKIIKGNLTCGTVNLVTMGGQIASKTHIVSDYIQLNPGVMGVFMCKSSDYPQTNCQSANNTPELMLTLCELGSIQYLFDQVNAEVVGFNSQFPTIQSFYDFLQQNGITVTDCNNSLIAKARANAYRPKNIINKENYLTRAPKNLTDLELQKINRYKDFNYNIAKNASNIMKKSSTDLEYTISNVHFINSNADISVDINLKSSVNTTYLDGCGFRLKYNPNAFGTNISSAATTTFSPSFTTSDYGSIVTSDYHDSILTVYVSAVMTPSNRVQITTSPIKLMTVIIPVNNCKFYPNFKIDNFTSASSYTYYAISASADRSISGNILQYDNIIIGATAIGSICDPEVTSLNKTNMKAGTKEQLIINGNNFGTTKGTVFVQIADAVNSSLNIQKIPLDDYDVSWSDNQIVVQMPGKIQNAYFNGTSYIPATPGSGPITVMDSYGNSYVNSGTTNIALDYVVFENYQGTGTSFYKSNQLLFSNNSDSVYHFQLHTNITNTGMINCIKAAFRKWSCNTGVAFVLDNTTTTQNSGDDAYNVIKLSTISNNDVLARTNSWTKNTCTSDLNKPFPVSNIDFEINDSKIDSFDYDTTGYVNMGTYKYDFFQIFLHEFGHAHQLGHLTPSNDIMYKASSKGVTVPNRRLTLSNNNLTGGDYVMSHSMANTYGLSCAYNIPIKKFGTPCRSSSGINEISSSGSIQVFPNPFNNNINIILPPSVNEKVVIKIINYLGEEVYSGTHQSTSSSIEINNISLANGMYFISVTGETSHFITKIICTK